jgi:hypothetical protein
VGTGETPFFDIPYHHGEPPDVSMDADPTTGMLVGQTQTFPGTVAYDTYRIGGTSLASPLFAGMTALKIQATGHGLGLLNPTIYTDHSGFHDVTGAGVDAGNIRVELPLLGAFIQHGEHHPEGRYRLGQRDRLGQRPGRMAHPRAVRRSARMGPAIAGSLLSVGCSKNLY